MPNTVLPRDAAAALTEPWSPRVIAEIDDACVKVAKVQGRTHTLAEQLRPA